MSRAVALVLGSFLFLALRVDAGPQLVVAKRFAEQCSDCAVTVKERRTAMALARPSFNWRPAVNANNAVLRFSAVSKGPSTITVRQSSKVILKQDLDDGAAWEVDVPIAKLAAADEFAFDAMSPKGGVQWVNPVILVPAAGRPRPNILLICIDTLRADRMGPPRNAMPKTYAWLQRGARFTRAYANAPWTLPSISTILTGVYPGVHNAGRRSLVGPSDRRYDMNPKPGKHGYVLAIEGSKYEFRRLSPAVPTMAQLMRAGGYYTAAIHENGYLNSPIDALRGFDLAHEYGKFDAESGTTAGLAWLKKNRDTRFALFLHYIEVHQWPLDVPRELRNADVANLTPEQRAQVAKYYDERCAKTDAAIDRLLEELEATGVLQNTIVIFTSDHGEAIAEYGRIDGHGAGVEENILRVPLGVFGHGIRPSQINTRVSLVSVLPTILDYAGLPAHIESSPRTLRPMIEGAARPDRDFISEFVLYGGDQWAMYTNRWKYVEDEGTPYLFDLARDAAAVNDVAGANPDLTERFRRQFRKRQLEMLARLRATRDEGLTLSRETIESLRALGYLNQ